MSAAQSIVACFRQTVFTHCTCSASASLYLYLCSGIIPGYLAFCMLLAKQSTSLYSPVQAERWGSELLTEDVEHVDLSKRPFTVRTSDTEVQILLLPDVQLSACNAHVQEQHYIVLMLCLSGENTQHHHSDGCNCQEAGHTKRGEVLESGHQRMCHL